MIVELLGPEDKRDVWKSTPRTRGHGVILVELAILQLINKLSTLHVT
jgi:hypothetical protein